ncbi:MAG: hypothetical protein BMS9Abin34_120 [Patescibacteria group bacterium]|nr:MAG: hypothetical protein BMS9Abin34_120 [Patescibacteria group bacterium]
MAEAKSKKQTARLTIPTPEKLLEAGVHFGHLKRRWHPKMAPYIYTEKDGVHVFDLFKTQERLKEAALFLRDVAAGGGSVLFVGTKRQAREIIERRPSEQTFFSSPSVGLGGF